MRLSDGFADDGVDEQPHPYVGDQDPTAPQVLVIERGSWHCEEAAGPSLNGGEARQEHGISQVLVGASE